MGRQQDTLMPGQDPFPGQGGIYCSRSVWLCSSWQDHTWIQCTLVTFIPLPALIPLSLLLTPFLFPTSLLLPSCLFFFFFQVLCRHSQLLSIHDYISHVLYKWQQNIPPVNFHPSTPLMPLYPLFCDVYWMSEKGDIDVLFGAKHSDVI